MKLQKNTTMARGFLQAILLALLLHTSGHLFLHFGDAALVGDETHLGTSQETKSVSAPQHQCSICQNHQHLALETPVLADFKFVQTNLLPTRPENSIPSILPAQFRPSRAPPRA